MNLVDGGQIDMNIEYAKKQDSSLLGPFTFENVDINANQTRQKRWLRSIGMNWIIYASPLD